MDVLHLLKHTTEDCTSATVVSPECLLMVQAANILSSIQDSELQHKPAVLATCLALLEQQGDVAGAISRVQEGLHWWQSSMTAEPAAQAAAQSWLHQQMVHLQLKV